MSPITEMIADMVKQVDDVRFKRTESVIGKITGECCGCNDQLPINELTYRKYLHPYEARVLNGHFCKKCLKDSKIKSLFV